MPPEIVRLIDLETMDAFVGPVAVRLRRSRYCVDARRLSSVTCARRRGVSRMGLEHGTTTEGLPQGPVAPKPSDTWELDFYSRPVVGADGKRLWELIVTDSSGVMEVVEPVPNAMVNSRELRKRFQQIVEESSVKPRTVRYFRSQMTNMIRIALEEFGVVIRPSRRTYSLFTILEDRELNVYPKMPGFKPGMRMDAALSSIKVPEKLPDALMGEKYSFAFVKLEELLAGEEEPIPFRELCPIDSSIRPEDTIPGLVIFSRRAKGIAAWMSGIELASVSPNLPRRELVIECGLNTQYLFAKLNDERRAEAKAFVQAREDMKGLHFLVVQNIGDNDDVSGFWLLRDIEL